MKKLHFSDTYFHKKRYIDPDSDIRVLIKETKSMSIEKEPYSLRIKTIYESGKKDYTIEHHLPPSKHSFPHLQFKFHTDEIGQFRIRIIIKDNKEYEKAILGFIYKIKDVMKDLEKYKKGITKEIMVLELVNKLRKKGDFLDKKMFEGITEYSLEFNKKQHSKEKIKKLKANPLLNQFIGKKNIKLIETAYKE